MLTHQEWIDRALSGEPVVSVGQLDKRTIAKLNSLVKSGKLIRIFSYHYPKPATLWFLA
jgi:hypothetical protein